MSFSGPNPKDPEYIKAKLADMSRVPLDKRFDTIALNSDISVLKRVLDGNKSQPSPEVGPELLGEVEKTRAALEARYRQLNPIADKYGRSRTSRAGRLSVKFKGGERHPSVIKIVDHHMQKTYNGDLAKYVAGMDRTLDKLIATKDAAGLITPQAMQGLIGASLVVEELGFRGADIKGLKAKIASTRSMVPVSASAAGRLSAAKFCRCIKQVRKTVKARKGSTREQAAIGICVKSVLHSRGKTIKTFSCGKKARLITQRRKGGCACNWK
jgi:hypothetical protein